MPVTACAGLCSVMWLRALSHAGWDPGGLWHVSWVWLQQESFEPDVRQAVSLFSGHRPPVCPGRPSGRGGLLSKTGWSFPCGSVCLTSVQASPEHGHSHPYSQEKASTAVPEPKPKPGDRHAHGGRDGAEVRGCFCACVSQGGAGSGGRSLSVNIRCDIYRRPNSTSQGQ